MWTNKWFLVRYVSVCVCVCVCVFVCVWSKQEPELGVYIPVKEQRLTMESINDGRNNK